MLIETLTHGLSVEVEMRTAIEGRVGLGFHEVGGRRVFARSVSRGFYRLRVSFSLPRASLALAEGLGLPKRLPVSKLEGGPPKLLTGKQTGRWASKVAYR